MAAVTISREFGSGGLEVAKGVAERLGYSYLDRAIVTEVARMVDIPEWRVEQYDEKGPRFTERLLATVLGEPSWAGSLGAEQGDWAEPSIRRGEDELSRIPSREDIISMVEHLIRGAARLGNVVVVGRGGQVILADRPDALHVRVVGPMELRTQRIAKQEGIGQKETMALIQKTDRNRERYIKHNYGVDWQDSSLYHLTINIAQTGISTATHLIADAATRVEEEFLRKFPGKNEEKVPLR